MDSTQRLIVKAKEMGIDTDEVLFSVCVGDVIGIIAEKLIDTYKIEQEYVEANLKKLIEIGFRGCKNIEWVFPIEEYLINRVRLKVFVYGTLRKGCGNHFVMKDADGKYIGTGIVKGYEMYTNGSYPMVIRGEASVVGEVYEVEKVENLYRLDALEGYPYLYIRETTEVELESGEKVKALIYTQSHNAESVRQNRIKIAEGDWVEWLRKERGVNVGV